MIKVKYLWGYVLERRASFSFTLGSIGYGIFHFLHPNFLQKSVYEPINFIFRLLGGRYFGLLFIVLGGLKLYGLFRDRNALKLPMYFALLFLWILLSVGLAASHFMGHTNSVWIHTAIIALLSTTIIKSPDHRGDGRA